MNNTTEHQQLVDDILFEVGSRPDVRCWPVRVGVGQNLHTGNVTRYGTKGEADIQGIVKICGIGIYLAIEVKTGTGRLSPSQKIWREMFEKFGGIYIEARDSLSAVLKLDEAIEKINEHISEYH